MFIIRLGKSSGELRRKRLREVIRQSLNSFRRKAEGEFEVVVIDAFTRKENLPAEVHVRVRTGNLYPKQGDLMQVARYAIGGSGSVYTPARVIRDPINGLPKVYLDLFDWKIPQIRDLDNLYGHFKSEICSGKEFVRQKTEEDILRRNGVD
jgi:hypothetical protein